MKKPQFPMEVNKQKPVRQSRAKYVVQDNEDVSVTSYSSSSGSQIVTESLSSSDDQNIVYKSSTPLNEQAQAQLPIMKNHSSIQVKKQKLDSKLNINHVYKKTMTLNDTSLSALQNKPSKMDDNTHTHLSKKEQVSSNQSFVKKEQRSDTSQMLTFNPNKVNLDHPTTGQVKGVVQNTQNTFSFQRNSTFRSKSKNTNKQSGNENQDDGTILINETNGESSKQVSNHQNYRNKLAKIPIQDQIIQEDQSDGDQTPLEGKDRQGTSPPNNNQNGQNKSIYEKIDEMNDKQLDNFAQVFMKQCNQNENDVINISTIAKVEKQMSRISRLKTRTKYDRSKEDKWISSSGNLSQRSYQWTNSQSGRSQNSIRGTKVNEACPAKLGDEDSISDGDVNDFNHLSLKSSKKTLKEITLIDAKAKKAIRKQTTQNLCLAGDFKIVKQMDSDSEEFKYQKIQETIKTNTQKQSTLEKQDGNFSMNVQSPSPPKLKNNFQDNYKRRGTLNVPNLPLQDILSPERADDDDFTIQNRQLTQKNFLISHDSGSASPSKYSFSKVSKRTKISTFSKNKKEDYGFMKRHPLVFNGYIIDNSEQQDDNENRRYRMYQHYLKKARIARKLDDTAQYKSKKNASSSSSDDDINVKANAGISKFQKMKQAIKNRFTIFRNSKQLDQLKEKKLSKRVEYHRRRSIRNNLDTQQELVMEYNKCKDLAQKELIKTELGTLRIELEKIEEDNGEQAYQKSKSNKKLDEMDEDGCDSGEDSNDDDYFDQTIQLITMNQSTKDFLMIDPDSALKAYWEVAGLFFIIYQSLLIPYRICFNADATGFLYYVETVIDVCFMLDILVNFNSGFYRRGNVIYKRSEVAKNYIMTWFLIDCLASFPYQMLIDVDLLAQSGDGKVSSMMAAAMTADREALLRTPQLLKLMKLARFLRFLRLLRVFKLKQILYRLEELIMSDSLMAAVNMMKVVCVVIFIAHWIACAFFAIGQDQLSSHRHCWIREFNLQDSAIDEQYIASLYWALATMTTVGYGDIYPITNSEKLFAMLAMLVSCGVFAYVVGSIENIVRASTYIDSEFKQTILHVNQYLIRENIPKDLRMSVRRYLERLQDHKKKEKMTQQEVMNELQNDNLQDQLFIEIVGSIFQSQKLMKNFGNDRLQSNIIFMLRQECYSIDDVIFFEGDNEDKFAKDQSLFEGLYRENSLPIDRINNKGIFFIIQGQMLVTQRKSKTFITNLGQGKIFGEIGFFTGRPRTVTIKSKGFSELMYLDKYKFLKYITQSKFMISALKEFEEIAMKMLEQPDDYSPLYIKCYLCKSKGHIAIDCEFFSSIAHKSKEHKIRPMQAGWTAADVQAQQQHLLSKMRENFEESGNTDMDFPSQTKEKKPKKNHDSESSNSYQNNNAVFLSSQYEDDLVNENKDEPLSNRQQDKLTHRRQSKSQFSFEDENSIQMLNLQESERITLKNKEQVSLRKVNKIDE